MYDYHIVIGAAAMILGFFGFSSYIWSVIKGETKPHAFTWIAYALIDGTVFFVQTAEGGGAGTWILGLTTIMCSLLGVMGLLWGERQFRTIDWVCLVGALVGIVFWRMTDDALLAVVLASAVNTIGIIPTFRKSYIRPGEESLTVWVFGVIQFALSIIALEARTLTTVLFPLAIIIANAGLVLMLLIRRRQLKA